YSETVGSAKTKGKVASGAAFSPVAPLSLVDLTTIPFPESFFDGSWNRERRQARTFLQAFADTLSQPIKKDNRYHIHYLPTQVFTEYIRYELKSDLVERFHGIKYRSSRKKGGICFAIFADQDECLPGSSNRKTPQLLEFVTGSIRTISSG